MLSKRRTPPIRTSSRPFRLGAGGQESGRGGSRARIQGPSQNAPSPPSGRRRRGRAQAALCARNPRSRQVRRRIAPPVLRQRPAAMGEACGYAQVCCGRLCESVPSPTLAVRCLVVTKDGSPTRRTAMPMELPRHASSTLPPATAGAFSPLSLVVGLARVRAQAGEAVARGCRVGHVSIRGRSACTSLSCCESWRGRGCALGLMVATFQRKQFPLRCAHSSRDKFFSLPGSPLRFDRKRCGQPIPRRTDHNKDALARPCSTRKEKHHG